ncbi:MAG: hypothetical protein R3325_03325 [Thermoanaerobaculia bacterium]|nr:hypothetical protein [Thermoanaerobaculia bacterium]
MRTTGRRGATCPRGAPGLAAGLILAALVAMTATRPAPAVEISTTHHVLEKPAKPKKVDATLYLPFLDQARRDSASRPRRVECAVTTRGARGPLPGTGRLDLALVGATGTGAAWRGALLPAALDTSGRAVFEAGDLDALLDAALSAGVEPELIEVTFAGGRGKRIETVTIGCLREPAEE